MYMYQGPADVWGGGGGPIVLLRRPASGSSSAPRRRRLPAAGPQRPVPAQPDPRPVQCPDLDPRGSGLLRRRTAGPECDHTGPVEDPGSGGSRPAYESDDTRPGSGFGSAAVTIGLQKPPKNNFIHNIKAGYKMEKSNLRCFFFWLWSAFQIDIEKKKTLCNYLYWNSHDFYNLHYSFKCYANLQKIYHPI